ncbi:hypothetical protein [Paenibacillus sp. N3.4]|uniref:hypothetical protein n=1 Tax=Paenibacillus sp. N3.4 TaxID=2603222 RepID=UPI00164F61FC|nr:hypothetical protein [Paenibacillus sp. N3.4]
MSNVTALAIVLSFLIVSIAFRQVTLHMKLKDLLKVDLNAKRRKEPMDDEHLE